MLHCVKLWMSKFIDLKDTKLVKIKFKLKYRNYILSLLSVEHRTCNRVGVLPTQPAPPWIFLHLLGLSLPWPFMVRTLFSNKFLKIFYSHLSGIFWRTDRWRLDKISGVSISKFFLCSRPWVICCTVKIILWIYWIFRWC